jgi:hypothetical protein
MQAESLPLNSIENVMAFINSDIYKGLMNEEPVINITEKSSVIQEAEDIAYLYGSQVTKERRWRDWTNEEKIAGCYYQTGIMANKKVVNGDVIVTPLTCNLCEKCYQANALKLKNKVKSIAEDIEKSSLNGNWRMKVVDKKTEAQSLKKRIVRNQESRHFEVAADEDGKSEVWSYVIDEPGKDMDKIYGAVNSPLERDFNQLYERNRSTGKKMSVGKAFRKPVAPQKNENKLKVLIPQVIVKDQSRQSETETIMERTNLVQEAKTAQEVVQLYLLQFKYIMLELKRAGIEIAAVKFTYSFIPEKQLMEDWNKNVRKWRWLSDDASYTKDNDLFTDIDIDLTSRLIFPATEIAQ